MNRDVQQSGTFQPAGIGKFPQAPLLLQPAEKNETSQASSSLISESDSIWTILKWGKYFWRVLLILLKFIARRNAKHCSW